MPACTAGYVCAALSSAQVASSFGASLPAAEGQLGVCAYAPNVSSVLASGWAAASWPAWHPAPHVAACLPLPGQGLLLPPPSDVPPALAFFPLGSQTLQSFPVPQYGGSAAGAGVVADPLFGSALLCTDEDSDLVGGRRCRAGAGGGAGAAGAEARGLGCATAVSRARAPTPLSAPRPPAQVALDSVPYGRSGAFSVNVWFRPANLSGTRGAGA